MESQPQNPEFRIIHENFHPCHVLQDLQSALGPSCLQYRLSKYISKLNSRLQLSRMVGTGFSSTSQE